jgi:predicted dehydrogenase
MSKTIFGVIGCSRVALKSVLPALCDSPFVSMGMIGSRNPENAKDIASRFGASAWGGYDDVIANPEIDAVYISVPSALHEAWAIKALEAGKHVWCEKPATTSYASAKRMVDAAGNSGHRLLEGFMFTRHPQNAKVRTMVECGALGTLLRFEGCFGYAMPDRESNAMNKDMGGGALFACGVYPIAASRFLFGEEPVSVFCKFTLDPKSGVDVRANVYLEYPEGKTAFASCFFGSYYQSTYGVLGTLAHVRTGRAYAVPRDMPTKIYFDADDRIREIVVGASDCFRIMCDEFCQEISKGSDGVKDYEGDLLAQARVVEAARISAAETRIVRLSEIG